MTREFPQRIQAIINDYRAKRHAEQQFEVNYGALLERIVPILIEFEERFGATRLVQLKRGRENLVEPYLRIIRDERSTELRYKPNRESRKVEVAIGEEVWTYPPESFSDELIEGHVESFARGALGLVLQKDEDSITPA